MELGAGIMGAETPVDGGPGDIASDRIGVDGPSQRHVISAASLQAVPVNTLNSIFAIPSATSGQD